MKDRQIIFGIMVASTILFSSIKIYNNGQIDKAVLETFKKEISVAFDSAEKDIIKVIPDIPVNKCECNGTKEIVHGDGHRTPCPCPAGQCQCAKKQEPVASAPAVDKSLILYTRSDCVYCKTWKLNEMPKFVADGWKVTEVTTNEGMVPRIEFNVNGQVKLKTLYSRLSEVSKLLNE